MCVCVCVCVYIYLHISTLFIFIYTKKTSKTQPVLEVSFRTKFCECFFDFLGLTKFLRLEMVDWSKPLKFSTTCSS